MAEYNPEDWENIPQIIPTSIAAISRQLQSIDAWMKKKDAEESTHSISLKMNKQENRLQDKIDNLINEKQVQLTLLTARIDEAKKEIEKLKEKPEIKEAVVQSDLTLKDLENHTDISEDEHSEGEDLGLLNPGAPAIRPAVSPTSMNRMVFERILKKNQEDKQADMVKPRMYSLEIFKKLLFKYLNRSKLKTKVLMQEQLIPSLEVKTDAVVNKIDSTVYDFKLEVKNIYEQLEFYKETLTKVYSEVETKLRDVSSWSERVEVKFTEIDQNQEDLKLKTEVMHEDYDILKQFTKKLEERIAEVVKELKDDVRKKVDFSQKTLRKETAKSFEGVEEKIEETNKAIQAKYELCTSEYLAAIQSAADVQENITKSFSADLSQQIVDYRSFYERDMEGFQRVYNENNSELIETDKRIMADLKKLRVEFDKWVSTVMEPAHISEARIFTVEARVKEEEAARLDQLHFMKDVMRKLLFSLEQAQITTLLPGIRPASRAENEPNVTLFMKRLGFLKKLVQYSVDQQKSMSNYVRRSSPLTVKDHFQRSSLEETYDAPFLTEKSRFRETKG